MKFRKILIVILFVFVSVLPYGCKKGEKTEINEITLDNVFNQSENNYLLCFLDTSSNSNTIKEKLVNYANSTNKNKLAYNIYVCYDAKVSDDINLIGVTDYQDIEIKNIPTLVKVTSQDNKKTVSLFYDSITDINSYIYGLEEGYRLKFNLKGGKITEEYNDYFNESYNYSLPCPEKEGFVFAGWTYNGKIVTSLDNHDYELEATWESEFDYNYLEDKEIFDQTEETYLVLFIKDDCPYCEKIKNKVLSFMAIDKDKNKLYVVNLKKDGLRSTILRSYQGLNGQSDDGDIYVDGVEKWDDLYISGTPTLIKVNTADNKKYSRYLEIGATKVVNMFNKILLSKNDTKYTINIDLGYDNKKTTLTFSEWEDIKLPAFTREGYTFVCFEENGEVIDKFVKKNYNIKVVWGKLEYTKDENIFSMSGNYLVLFMISNDSNFDNIKSNVMSYMYKSNIEKYKGTNKLYVVNLKDGDNVSKIYRTFSKDVLVKVDGATTIDELYIYKTPLLVEIKNGVAKLCAETTTEIIDALENFLVKDGVKGDTNLYEISFDINYDVEYNGEIVNKIPSVWLYKWQTLESLPVIKKEGSTLLYWSLNDKEVSTIKGQKALLKPVWINKDYYEEIQDKEVFNQKENRYLVYFMKDGCTYCEQTKPSVLEYVSKASTDKYKNSPKIYVINLKTNGVKSLILRSYDNESGTYVDGVTEFKGLYIPSTPTLIEVSGDVPTASLLAIGKTNVINALNKELTTTNKPIGEKKAYTINIDLGYDNLKETISFYNGNDVALPSYEREGYVLVSYEENGLKINSFSNRNYNIKCNWVSKENYKTIEEENIFNAKENRYYILFIKNSNTKIDEILELAIKCQYTYDIPLYVVNLEKKTISRPYKGDDGEGYNNKFYVSKARSVEELYIYVSPTIIEINKGKDNKILGSFSAEVIKYLNNLLS